MRTAFWGRDAIHPGQAVEQFEPYLERELLAGERIEERLEKAREARRLDSAKTFDERPEPSITAGESIKVCQIRPEPERALEHGDHPRSLASGGSGPAPVAQTWSREPACATAIPTGVPCSTSTRR